MRWMEGGSQCGRLEVRNRCSKRAGKRTGMPCWSVRWATAFIVMVLAAQAAEEEEE